MKNSFIEGMEKAQLGLADTTLKCAAVMILGGVVTSAGIYTMLRGQETMIEASTMYRTLDIVKEEFRKVEVG